ncbi:MAG: peptide chain release factor H [Lewinellaceae bacterium]|nr:peptide chain release factor H [Lewinellaceae bacterium]
MQKLVQITSGRGPIECTRVVARVLQIFLHEASSFGFEAKILNQINGNSMASIETAMVQLNGDEKLPDFLKSWLGTVQWIGESEIRKNHQRKNWYIGIFEMDIYDICQIQEKDISYQSMLSSGAGGQHVNKVSSAIRAMHIPTGLQVVAMDSRSQLQNKQIAKERLMAKFASIHECNILEQVTSQWKQRIQIERGNPTRIFKGTQFREVK